MANERDQELLDVLAHQKAEAQRVQGVGQRAGVEADRAICDSQALLRELGVATEPPGFPAPAVYELTPAPPIAWDQLVAQARASLCGKAGIEDLLDPSELAAIQARLHGLRREAIAPTQVDALDLAIAGLAGLLGSLVHLFLVGLPRRPGLFGLPAKPGGPLSEWTRERVNSSLPPESIRELERKFGVPYDASTNRHLDAAVSGLNPRSHRLHTPGHDPVLGFIFGVSDILRGRMTAIDDAGRWVVQDRGPASAQSLMQALWTQLGHLRSDVATPAGLPAPFMPLLLLVNAGSFGPKGHTVSEVVQRMYRQGYDFRHFIAMGVAPMVVEVVARVLWMLRQLVDGSSLSAAIPFGARKNRPRLHTILFLAHAVAAGCNAGQVALTGNPLAINLPQWMALAKATAGQLRWHAFGAEDVRHEHVSAALDRDFEQIRADLDRMMRGMGKVDLVAGG